MKPKFVNIFFLGFYKLKKNRCIFVENTQILYTEKDQIYERPGIFSIETQPQRP